MTYTYNSIRGYIHLKNTNINTNTNEDENEI
jgi:hypothetical protein